MFHLSSLVGGFIRQSFLIALVVTADPVPTATAAANQYGTAHTPAQTLRFGATAEEMEAVRRAIMKITLNIEEPKKSLVDIFLESLNPTLGNFTLRLYSSIPSCIFVLLRLI